MLGRFGGRLVRRLRREEFAQAALGQSWIAFDERIKAGPDAAVDPCGVYYVAVGPFLGYKVMSDAGFTFDRQLGFEHLSVQASAQGETASGKDMIVLLNLNIGWSF